MLSPNTAHDQSCLHVQAAKLASQLYFEQLDQTPVKQIYAISEFLGDKQPLSALVLSYYMKHFYFVNFTVLDALRSLSSQLFLNSESQKLDRILLQFAYTYCESQSCHSFSFQSCPCPLEKLPKVQRSGSTIRWKWSLFKPTQVTHAEVSMDPFLRHVPATSTGVAERGIWEGLGEQAIEIVHLIAYSLLLLNTDLHKHHGGNMTKTQFVKNTLKALPNLDPLLSAKLAVILQSYYASLKHQELQQPFASLAWFSRNTLSTLSVPDSIQSTPSRYDTKSFKGSISSFRTVAMPCDIPMPLDAVKQCVLPRKHLWSNKGRPFDRSWKTCVIQLTPQHWSMYLNNRSKPQKFIHGYGQHAEMFSGVTYVDYVCTRPHVFSITTSTMDVFLFQCTSAFDMEEWIQLLNVYQAKASFPFLSSHGVQTALREQMQTVQIALSTHLQRFQPIPTWYQHLHTFHMHHQLWKQYHKAHLKWLQEQPQFSMYAIDLEPTHNFEQEVWSELERALRE